MGRKDSNLSVLCIRPEDMKLKELDEISEFSSSNDSKNTSNKWMLSFFVGRNHCEPRLYFYYAWLWFRYRGHWFMGIILQNMKLSGGRMSFKMDQNPLYRTSRLNYSTCCTTGWLLRCYSPTRSIHKPF